MQADESVIKMTNACNFKLKYDGPALAESAIDVSDLAPALLNMSEALSALNTLLNRNDSKINLQVKAFNNGCFIVDFVLTQNLIAQVGSLLTGVGIASACNAYTLMKCFIDIVSLKKWIAGRKVDAFEFSEDHQNVTIRCSNCSITINRITYESWKNPRVNAACSKIVEPLRKEGLETVSVSIGDREETFDKNDVDSVAAPPDEVPLIKNVNKCIVTIETAAFKDKAKWRIKIGEQVSVFAAISDEKFLAAIDSGEERFGKGDVLLVLLEAEQTLSGGKIMVSYNITQVLEHKTSAEQLSLF